VRIGILTLMVCAALVGCAAGRGGATTTTRSADAPSDIARAIDREQAVVDDATASRTAIAAAGRAQQLAFRTLADHRGLRGPTLALLSSPAARTATVAALRAEDDLARILPPARRLPHWRIVAPPPPGTLLRYYRAAAARYGISWRYLAAIELVETRMGRIHGLSSAGAQGPMQFMPATWAEYGHGSIDSQHDSIMAAARFLAANGGRRDIGGALLHYNPTRWYVLAVETYARELRADPRAFYGYHGWEVLYRMARGTFLLPVGYPRVRPVRLPG
jgi:membrane-bound lytic murein transglycosylase B